MERVNEAAAAAAAAANAACGPSPPGCYTYQVSRHSADLLHSLNQQRKNGGRFCDVLLRVGDESFPAHRAVLAACSEYFESVFSAQGLGGGGEPGAAAGAAGGAGAPDGGGAAEAPGAPGGGPPGVGRELEMHTISSKVFGDILDFAYTSRIVVRLESFPELMTAAKFLLMRSVIDICQEVIKQSNVQILVPPAARPDIMLFRPGATATDLGFPLDMTNGAGLAPNGNGIAGMPEDEATRAALSAAAQSLPVLQGVDRLPMVAGPLSPPLLASPFQNVGAATPSLSSKRGRGRPRKANLLDSMMFSTPGGLRDAGILPCGLCGKVFTDANRLRQHEAQHGVTSLQLGYIDIPPQRLSENGVPGLDDPEAPRKRSRTRKQVACEICGKIFRDVYHLNRHKLSHSGEKPYSCPVCGLRFKRKDRMSYHVRSHDGSVGKPYICQSCGKGFSRPDHLNGHIKQVHTSERPHKCQQENASLHGISSETSTSIEQLKLQETCNASFATRDRLRSHLACHEDKVPCQVCGKYLRAAYMADHLKKHSEGPSNFCTICNREGQKCSHLGQIESSDSYGDLSDTSDLKTPEKQTANGSFSCDMVVAKNKLESEGDKKYPCPECGSFFRSKSYLNKHIQKVHVRSLGAPLGDLGPALGSPFSPQQNMSLLESFGFQIVQSAFASSLVDPDVDQQAMGPDGK
ncbi:POZ-, AT hook-, and zinc finger-containing protein 1 isoform X4 [Hemicordylus capensis]|uniref:POZ-, AT hook-, and zinc finger-containing protein 1 isoform X4 n=1 Tax=Hemicordylus capensis TaxID=884348 RepID=UPI002302C11D|nr:POZ-, AT hook-, and zinc finger-containing protein 1 isoform X4 [Hemicordylus capensis]